MLTVYPKLEADGNILYQCGADAKLSILNTNSWWQSIPKGMQMLSIYTNVGADGHTVYPNLGTNDNKL